MPVADFIKDKGLVNYTAFADNYKEKMKYMKLDSNNVMAAGIIKHEMQQWLRHGTDEQKQKARLYIKQKALLANNFTRISVKTANAHYVNLPVNTDVKEQKSPVRIATEVVKDVVASLVAVRPPCIVNDVGSGFGSVYKRIDATGLKVKKYNFVEPNRSKMVELQSKSYVVDAMAKCQCNFIECLPSSFIKKKPDGLFILMNNYHMLDDEDLSFMNQRTHFGMAMVSNFIVEGVVEQGSMLVKKEGRWVGNIGTLQIDERPMVISDFNYIYPVHNILARSNIRLNGLPDFFRKSFGLVLNAHVPRDIMAHIGMAVVPMRASRAPNFFRRPPMHAVSEIDGMWNSEIAHYVSPKLNGVAGFLDKIENVYYFYLRNGESWMLLDGNSEPIKLGVGAFPGPLFVELVPLRVKIKGQAMDKIFLFYNCEMVTAPKTPDEVTNYWANYFTVSLETRLRNLNYILPGLSTKPYWVIKDDIDLEPGKYPNDGVVFTDIHGMYQSFWKPFVVQDVHFELGNDGLIAPEGYEIIVQPEGAHQGVYECVVRGSQIIIGGRRLDKDRKDIVRDYSMLDYPYEEGYLYLPYKGLACRINMGSLTISSFADRSVNRPPQQVFDAVREYDLSDEVLSVYYDSVLPCLKRRVDGSRVMEKHVVSGEVLEPSCSKGSKPYKKPGMLMDRYKQFYSEVKCQEKVRLFYAPIREFEDAVVQITKREPSVIWQQFYDRGMVANSPYAPVVIEKKGSTVTSYVVFNDVCAM